MTTFTVRLNGTDTNPYHKFGLKQNPFPQAADYNIDRHLSHLAELGADPIPDAEYIRQHLKGWSKEFVDGCCERFRKGEMVVFNVVLPGVTMKRELAFFQTNQIVDVIIHVVS